MSLFKKIKKTIFKKQLPAEQYPLENGIRYIHRNPDRGNIGDYLCSPRHYFSFTTSRKNLSIVGGGVFPGHGLELLKKKNIDAKNSVLWGTGLSVRQDQSIPEKLSSLEYMQWGIRDMNFVQDAHHFLPCVSCLHSMLDTDTTSDTTCLFINADEKVSHPDDLSKLKQLANAHDWQLIFNNCDEQTITEALHKHGNIVTNSYHGAYWGLLSGKKVNVLGYSTKFTNLLACFGFNDDKLHHIGRGQRNTLIKGLQTIASNPQSKQLSIADARNMLIQYRTLNINFANRLVENNIVETFSLKA